MVSWNRKNVSKTSRSPVALSWVRSLKSEWVLVVDVGMGVWRLGSKSSVVEESRGVEITRLLSVWVASMVVVGVRACIVLLDPR